MEGVIQQRELLEQSGDERVFLSHGLRECFKLGECTAGASGVEAKRMVVPR